MMFIGLKKLHALFCLLVFFHIENSNNNKYVIGQWPGGLGVCITAVLSQLVFCKYTGKKPVIYWNNKYYLNPNGFNGSKNIWEYYFQQTSDLSYIPGDKINIFFSGQNFGNFSYYQAHKSPEMRLKAYTLIQEYIKLNSIVQKKVDNFYDTYMKGTKTIGIHIRGTNKYLEDKPVKVEEVISKALNAADEDTQFLIATDDQKIFDEMLLLLQGKKVIYYDCYRSTDGQPLLNYKFRHPKPSFAQMGEDVLVEIYLLSKTDMFFHTLSNVSSIVLYLNPYLKNIISIAP